MLFVLFYTHQILEYLTYLATGKNVPMIREWNRKIEPLNYLKPELKQWTLS